MAILKQFCCGFSLMEGTMACALWYLATSPDYASSIPGIVHRLYYPRNTTELDAAQDDKEIISDIETALWAQFGLFIIQAICAACLFVGTLQEKAIVLLPWVVVHSLLTIGLTIISIILFYKIELLGWKRDSLSVPIEVHYIEAIISVLLDVFFLLVVFSYYQTLRENQRTN